MIKAKDLRLLNDNILVEGIKPETRRGVIIGVSTDDKPQEGKVLRVGPGKLLDSGERAKPSIAPGMYVLFNEHTTTKFNLEGKIYFVLKEEDLVGYTN